MRWAAILCVGIFLATSEARAVREAIDIYETQLTLEEDGSLLCHQVLAVMVGGNRIKRGIYLDLPLPTQRNGWLEEHRYRLEVLEVQRNGQPDAYKTYLRGENLVLRIGDPDTFLINGRHTYEITYRLQGLDRWQNGNITWQWPVIGRHWGFPIDSGSLALQLPPEVEPETVTVAVEPDLPSRGPFVWQTSEGLNEGLMLTMSIPAEALPNLAAPDPAWRNLAANRGVMIGLGGVVILLVWFLMAWVVVGRDPERGDLSPCAEIPAGVSPALARQVYTMFTMPRRNLDLNLYSLAVKGALKFRLRSSGRLEYHQRRKSCEAATEDEQLVLDTIFKYRSTVKHHENYKLLSKTEKALNAWMRANLPRYYRTNSIAFKVGVTLALVLVAVVGIGEFLLPHRAMFWLGAPLIALGCWFCLEAWFFLWQEIWRRDGKRFLTWALTSVVLGTGAAWLAIWYFLDLSVAPVLGILLGIVCFLVRLFWTLLKVPTAAGRELQDQLTRLRRFLCGEPPTKSTPPIDCFTFERYLPFAMALLVESQWAATCEEAMAKNGRKAKWKPAWYQCDDHKAPFEPSTLGVVMPLRTLGSTNSSGSSGSFSSGGSVGGFSGGGGGGGGW